MSDKSYCAGFPGAPEVDEVDGTVTFGGMVDGMTCPDGTPYQAWITIPKFLWERMAAGGLYVRIAGTEDGILGGLASDESLPVDCGLRETYEKEAA